MDALEFEQAQIDQRASEVEKELRQVMDTGKHFSSVGCAGAPNCAFFQEKLLKRTN